VGLPARQIDQWISVTLASFRLKEADSELAGRLRGTLTLLTIVLARGNLSDSDVSDLNWLLDSTIELLRNNSKNPRLCSLSAAELIEIEEKLAAYELPAEEAFWKSLTPDSASLDVLASTQSLRTITQKLRSLSEVATSKGALVSVARRALLFLTDNINESSDFLGPLAITQNLHVIETTYSLVKQQTFFLQLLEAFLQKWPFVAQLSFLGPSRDPLDRYGQFIACVCLDLLRETPTSLIVLRNNSAHSLIAAVMVAIESMTAETVAANLDVTDWRRGQAISISDGTKSFRAIYQGVTTVGNKKRFLIEVKNSGRITVSESVLPYMAATRCRPHEGGAARTGAGVRKPPREETAGGVARWRVKRYGD